MTVSRGATPMKLRPIERSRWPLSKVRYLLCQLNIVHFVLQSISALEDVPCKVPIRVPHRESLPHVSSFLLPVPTSQQLPIPLCPLPPRLQPIRSLSVREERGSHESLVKMGSSHCALVSSFLPLLVHSPCPFSLPSSSEPFRSPLVPISQRLCPLQQDKLPLGLPPLLLCSRSVLSQALRTPRPPMKSSQYEF